MNIQKRANLINSYGSLDSFVRKTNDVDFIWGISDVFGYEHPADFVRLDRQARTFVAISFFCKEYLQGGFASVISNLPEFLRVIESGLITYENGILAAEFSAMLNMASVQNVDLSDDDARWDFVEKHGDFRSEFLKCQGALPRLVANLRNAIGAQCAGPN